MKRMTREEVAKMLNWPEVIFWIGILNAVAVVPQLIQLVLTRVTEGLSIPMLFIFLFVQIGFTLHGYFQRDRALLYGIGLSAVISSITIVVAIHYRSMGL